MREILLAVWSAKNGDQASSLIGPGGKYRRQFVGLDAAKQKRVVASVGARRATTSRPSGRPGPRPPRSLIECVIEASGGAAVVSRVPASPLARDSSPPMVPRAGPLPTDKRSLTWHPPPTSWTAVAVCANAHKGWYCGGNPRTSRGTARFDRRCRSRRSQHGGSKLLRQDS